MSIDAAAPGRPFSDVWLEIERALSLGSKIGKYYGRAFTIKSISDSEVTIDSTDAGGLVGIAKRDLEDVYTDWRGYRYERMTHQNTQNVLHSISIIQHVVQTWVRIEERAGLVERSRKAGIVDGVFWVVNYNRHRRLIGPNPKGESVSVSEVFPNEPPSRLVELELAAGDLHGSASTISALVFTKDFDAVAVLAAKYPGFSRDAYASVVGRACYMASK